ncbi:EamA family transporter [Zavarzinia sp. CC-PAN008]|uniref:EamA family transporter n=1 Tax=Zavarzinia sp. CC-PAN008 TaxID=3243332 RepID=UPI003F7496AB
MSPVPSGAPAPSAALWRVLGPLFVLAAVVISPIGAGLAKEVGTGRDVMALAFWRNALGATVLLIVTRPALWRLSAAQWRAGLALGAVVAMMNVTFYMAIQRLPLGIVLGIEFLGPLSLSLMGARRPLDFAWPALALCGGLLLTPLGGMDHADPLGFLLAIAAGACWAGYILLSARAGRLIPGVTGLAVALMVAAVILIPFGGSQIPTYMASPQLALGVAAVAVLSTSLPYGLEMLALRHVATATFGVLTSTQPAIAALVGWFLLKEALPPTAILGIVLVSTAGIGATLGRRPQPGATRHSGGD